MISQIKDDELPNLMLAQLDPFKSSNSFNEVKKLNNECSTEPQIRVLDEKLAENEQLEGGQSDARNFLRR